MHLLMQPIDANGARALARTLRRTSHRWQPRGEIRVSEMVSGAYVIFFPTSDKHKNHRILQKLYINIPDRDWKLKYEEKIKILF